VVSAIGEEKRRVMRSFILFLLRLNEHIPQLEQCRERETSSDRRESTRIREGAGDEGSAVSYPRLVESSSGRGGEGKSLPSTLDPLQLLEKIFRLLLKISVQRIKL
jgi:hypothetical protein